MTSPHEAALEAACRAVWAELPVDRGTSATAAAETFAQAAITAYLNAMREAGQILAPVEPTDEMVEEFGYRITDYYRDVMTFHSPMIAAAQEGE